ncbi:hypothetical protein EMIHUDRAFT_456489 [Emiliania huxleyi CCMP1516]|uniref:Protein transport protein SEC23 n=2 Tax=Emiliania huxleyi TaxID=2903 RepID=A0A0D3K4P6_EMIH1|nr:hypothetical protein EMIHUDRAFT_456489 [Emiliania huxleyi CCMP1516]EOD30731.1 hypothetical protein EMIHUDRAFT_456489 [Emiliania huxleyi CCMP1516]|eukprot:XP_005783160.1 hypothetical protein EMIHUDRAFT_456489 [Emiliania huxleyi CCMP1516]
MGDFHDVEATDGVRFSWNVWPSSRLEATRIVGTCPAMLNPYCRIDFKAKIWALKDSLEQVLQLLASAAPTALIGLITFGTVVQVHELGFEHCSKCYTFKGTKDPAPAQLAEQLGAPPHPAAHLPAAFPTAPCPTPTLTPCRAGISAGGARVMLFTGGPCTIGPGQTVGCPLAEPIRSHHDIEKETGNVKHMKKALKHYAGVAQRASKVGHVFDIFACALDQVGVAEMRAVVERTGGYTVMSESFTGNIFKQSLSQVFARDASGTALRMAFGGGTVEVLTSNEFKVCGAIGNCASLGKKSNNIGLGNTNAWSVGGLDEDTTLALYFEMAAQSGGQQQQQAGGQRYLQLLTSYQHSSGQYRLRVTTLARPWAEAAQAGEMARGFDQEAAAVLMARIASHKTQTEEARSLLRWIDPHRLADLSGWSADLLRRPPVPVLLDVTSIAPDRILLLDTFFHVIVYHGETISAWRKQGYHETAEHQNFRELLSAPKEDAAELLQQRFPVPMYIECDQYGSQARFLLAKLNPSVTHNSSQSGAASSDFLFTDDVSFQVFMDHLKRLAVESK